MTLGVRGLYQMDCVCRGESGANFNPELFLSGPQSVARGVARDCGHSVLLSLLMPSPRCNISTNYYLVVEMHTVTVRSDDARYLLN